MAFQKQKVFLSVPVFPVAVSLWSPGQPLFLAGGPAPAVTEEQGEEPNTTVQLSCFNSLLSSEREPLERGQWQGLVFCFGPLTSSTAFHSVLHREGLKNQQQIMLSCINTFFAMLFHGVSLCFRLDANGVWGWFLINLGGCSQKPQKLLRSLGCGSDLWAHCPKRRD